MNVAVAAISRAEGTVAEVAHRVANPERSLESLPRDTVELITSQRSFEANVAVIRTADQMLGTLVDTFA